MLQWTAAKNTPTRFIVRFTSAGFGSIELAESGSLAFIAHNHAPEAPLDFVLPARENLTHFALALTSYTGELPVEMELQQNGSIIQAEENALPANGQAPNYIAVPLPKTALYKTPRYFNFDVRFV